MSDQKLKSHKTAFENGFMAGLKAAKTSAQWIADGIKPEVIEKRLEKQIGHSWEDYMKLYEETNYGKAHPDQD